MHRLESVALHVNANNQCHHTEAVRHLLPSWTPTECRTITRWLDHDNHENREKVRAVALQHLELFTPRFNIPLQEKRNLAYRRLKCICEAKCISVTDFDHNPQNIFSMHEAVALLDGSLATKMTVQFNLFGGTVFRLGGKQHRWLIPHIDDLSQVGCFALTELGYGNNAVEMETTARHDPLTNEFIINSPTIKAQKYWITNGALHAHWAIVFAQLDMKSSWNAAQDHHPHHDAERIHESESRPQGIHAFLVRIRYDDLRICDGVIIEDMGVKIGLNGIDNAKLAFHDVRIPQSHLLDPVWTVTESRGFSSSVQNLRDRFLRHTQQLVSGRLCIASMMLGACKLTLAIGVRYAASRLSVGPSGKSDVPILSYQLLSDTLALLIAKTYVLNSAVSAVKEKFAQLYQASSDFSSPPAVEVNVLCCALKPALAWHALDVVDRVREQTGGQGYLACNYFGKLIGAAHGGLTAEGDNKVLWMKVAKELLAEDKVNETGLLKSSILSGCLNVMNDGVLADKLIGLLDCLHLRLCMKLESLRRDLSAANDRTALFNLWMKRLADRVQDVAQSFLEWRVLDFHIARVYDLVLQHVQPSSDQRGGCPREGECPTNCPRKEECLINCLQKGKCTIRCPQKGECVMPCPKNSACSMSSLSCTGLYRLTAPLLLMGYLFGLDAVKKDVLWMLQQKEPLVSQAFLPCIEPEMRSTIGVLAGDHGKTLRVFVDSFGIEDKLIFAPIAKDWESYNDLGKPKYGEIIAA